MSQPTVDEFKEVIKTGRRVDYWLCWDGTRNLNGGCNKKTLNPTDQDLYNCRKDYRTKLNAWHNKYKKKNSVGKLLLTTFGDQKVQSIQKTRTQDRISIRTGSNTDFIKYHTETFRPRDCLAYIMIRIKRYHLVNSLLLRIYKKRTNNNPELVYQEILDADDLDYLTPAKRASSLPSYGDTTVAGLGLGGEFEVKIWCSKNKTEFANLLQNDSPVASARCVHTRSVRIKGKKKLGDLAPDPTIKIPNETLDKKLLVVLPLIKTTPKYQKGKYFADICQANQIAAKVQTDYTRKITFIYDCVKKAHQKYGAPALNELRIIAMPEWYFQRTIDNVLPGNELRYYTSTEKDAIVQAIIAAYPNNIPANWGNWVIVPGTILWGLNAGHGRSVVFNTMPIIWRNAQGAVAVGFTYHKTVNGQDTPLSLFTDKVITWKNTYNTLNTGTTGTAGTIPQELVDIIKDLTPSKLTEPKILTAKTVNNVKWEIETQCPAGGRTMKPMTYNLILSKHGNNLKIVPRDHFCMEITAADWTAHVQSTNYFNAVRATALGNQDNHFDVGLFKFGLEICAEAQPTHKLAMKEAIAKYNTNLTLVNPPAITGADCHIVIANGSAFYLGCSVAKDGGCVLLTDGNSRGNKKLSRIGRDEDFEEYIKIFKNETNALTSASDAKKKMNDTTIKFTDLKVADHSGTDIDVASGHYLFTTVT